MVFRNSGTSDMFLLDALFSTRSIPIVSVLQTEKKTVGKVIFVSRFIRSFPDSRIPGRKSPRYCRNVRVSLIVNSSETSTSMS